MPKITRRNERGGTMVITAITLAALVAFAALAIDVGVLYTARTSAQHAADAAALAGAFEFANPCNSPAPPTGCAGWEVTTAAIQSARTVAAQNRILGQTVQIADEDVNVDTANQRVTVTVSRAGLPRYFSAIFNRAAGTVRTIATAEAGTSGAGTPGGTASHCLKPVFLPNTILAPPTESLATACANGHVIFSSTNTVTDWANTNFGNAYLIRPADPGVARNGLAPSQFYSLDFSNGTLGGADMYRCTLGNCLNTCGVSDVLSCGNLQTIATLDVETGNMVGPTTDGINTLIGLPPEMTWSEWSPGSPSRNLAVAAVWNNCSQTVVPGTNNNIRVVGFVEIFVDSVVQSGSRRGDVSAHVLGPIPCADVDAGGTGTPGPTTGPYTVPIRLVQNPAQQ